MSSSDRPIVPDSDDVTTAPAASATSAEPLAGVSPVQMSPSDELPPPLPLMPEPVIAYASWGSRVGAFLIDGMLEGIAQLVLGLILGSLAAFFLRGAGLMTDMSNMALTSVTISNAMSILWLGTSVLNRIIIQWYFGGTAAKLLFGIEVVEVTPEGVQHEASFWTLVKRYFFFWLSIAPFGVGLLAPLWTKRKQAFHDILGGTIVIERGSRKYESG